MPKKIYPQDTTATIEYLDDIDIHGSDTEKVQVKQKSISISEALQLEQKNYDDFQKQKLQAKLAAHDSNHDARDYLDLFIHNPSTNEYIRIGEIEMDLLRTLLGMPNG